MSRSTNIPTKSTGFTLIEMMISVGIFVVISGVVLANYNGFNSKVLLSNLAYDLALTIRQAQTFGISVRQGVGGSFANAYGVYIEEDDTSGVTTTFHFFYDTDADNTYDVPAPGTCSGECQKRFALTRGNRISQICVDTGSLVCSPSASVKSLTMMFKRPNPDTIYKAIRNNDTEITASTIIYATITVQSPKGDSKVITVRPTGQVSVN